MKRYAPLLLTFLFLPLLFSCFDLEEDLYDQLEKEDYYTDYESLMASVLRPYEHAKWAETNFSFWLQELSADQLVITQKREHWEDGGVWRMIHQHTWDTYEKNSEQMWNACYGGIGYCNNTLADIQELSYDNFGLAESDKRQHIAELTALRAYFQLLLLDAFRIPAISLTTEEEVGSATPQENFHFIEESLLNAIPDLPKAPSKNYEGRITQGAAAVLLMRLYFNASWYINIPMWEQTGALCERIINGEFGTYSLTSEWTDLWNAGNQDCPELIWSYPQSRQVGYDDFYYLFFMHYQAPERFGCGKDLPAAYNGCHLSPSYDPSGKPYPYTLGRTFSKFPDTDLRKKNFKVLSQGIYEGLFLFGPQQIYNSDQLQYGAEEWGNYPLIFIDQVARYSDHLSDTEKKALTDKQLSSDTPWIIRKYSINSLVYWVTYVHNVVYSFYRSMIYCYINSTQRCAGSIVIDIIPTNGADKRKFFPFAPYFPVTNVIKRYFYPYFPAIIGIKGYSFPYFPYLSGIMKIKTALYSLFSRLDWHKTVVFPCLGEIYEGIRSLSWEIPVT